MGGRQITLLGIWIVIATWIYVPSGTGKTLLIITGVLVFAVSLASGSMAVKRFGERHLERR
ncbi:MAG: hypothetical protein M1383_03315 [Patescibacteria group bacterium]|nr:hypothetical protein [Patescibacteria group bacterium]